MRNAFADELVQIAAADRRVILLSGDIGNRLFDGFKQRFPQRFYNCGVAEANMMGVAAGLAMSGLRPVAYTIAPFITSRCLEQIRVDVCCHNAPVVIVGVGAGLAYAQLGATHHACEDIAFLRVLPEMCVVCPGDPLEVRLALQAAVQHDGPVYLRLGKKGEAAVHAQPPPFAIGRAITLRAGDDVAILSTGVVLPLAVQVAERLRQEQIEAQVVSMHTVKPLDQALLGDVFARCPVVVTLEEHSILGGLGGAVAEWRCDHSDLPGRLLRFGTPDAFFHEAGGQPYARSRLGLDGPSIVRRIGQAHRQAVGCGR